MTTPIFQPAVPPDSGMTVTAEPRILEVKLGDGYVQRAADGINTRLEVVNPAWTNLYRAEAEPILEFFKEREGYKTFFWTRPTKDPLTQQQRWVCKSWTEKWKKGDYCDITAKFEESAW